MSSNNCLGLRSVPTEDLKLLLQRLHAKVIECPLDPAALACIGLQHRSEPLLGAMRGVDGRAVHAVLVCVIAERASLR